MQIYLWGNFYMTVCQEFATELYLAITKYFDNISRRRRQKCQIIISNTVSSHEYFCIKVMKVVKKLQDQLSSNYKDFFVRKINGS